jgi:transposase, IS6 family
MPMTTNSFKGRQYPGEVILQAVRWYLRYPLAYEHVSELLAERGLEVDASCVWRWVQVYSPELNKRCKPHLKRANKSYRVDETYIKVKGQDKYLYRAVGSIGRPSIFCWRQSATLPQLNASLRKYLAHPRTPFRGSSTWIRTRPIRG